MYTKNDINNHIKVEYNISLHYVPFIEFIYIKSGQLFAYNDEKVEIVSFPIGIENKIHFEKLSQNDQKFFNVMDSIEYLNDNKAELPQCTFKINHENERITDISTIIKSASTKENSYLSINYVFTVQNKKKFQVGLHMNTQSILNNSSSKPLLLFSDKTKTFTNTDVVINFGNLKRKVFLLARCFDNFNGNIVLQDLKISSKKIFKIDNINTDVNFNNIYAIFSFEVQYSEILPLKDGEIIDCFLEVNINERKQELPFKFLTTRIEIQEESIKISKSLNDFYFYDTKNDSFQYINVKKIAQNHKFNNAELQILISPYCFLMYDKTCSKVKLQYNTSNGTLSRIICNSKKEMQFDVLAFSTDTKKFNIITVEKHQILSHDDNNVYICARIKDDPSSFFSLFCPMINNSGKFNSCQKCSNILYQTFYNFFISIMPVQDRFIENYCADFYISVVDNLFRTEPISDIHIFAYAIDIIGKHKNHIHFGESIESIINFTNYSQFEIHFDKFFYGNNYKHDKIENIRFYSFILALKELIYERFIYLQNNEFCLELPIEKINEIQNELYRQKVYNENQLSNLEIIKEAENYLKHVKEIENFEIQKRKKKGMIITPVLKWTEKEGLKQSTLEEFNSNKNSKIKKKYEVNIIKSDLSCLLNHQEMKLIEFPEKLSIKLLYEKFDEILLLAYNYQFYICYLIENQQPLKEESTLLSQLNYIYNWIKEVPSTFPFPSFASKFYSAFSSIKENLKELSKPTMLAEFIQLPAMPVEFNLGKNNQQSRLNIINNTNNNTNNNNKVMQTQSKQEKPKSSKNSRSNMSKKFYYKNDKNHKKDKS